MSGTEDKTIDFLKELWEGSILYNISNILTSILQQGIQSFNVLSKDEVKDLFDKLSQKVINLEDGVDTAKEFHMITSYAYCWERCNH